MARVLIADGHPVTRAGFRQFIEAESSITEVAEAGSAVEALALLRVLSSAWDLLLLDIQMPNCDIFEILRCALADHPSLRVLAVSALPEEAYAVAAIRAGASGYISKDSTSGELLEAVGAMLAHRPYISRRVAQWLTKDLGDSQDKLLHHHLSTRELQIFRHLAAGKTGAKIGRELGLSVKTVDTYRERILEKMRVRSNASLTAYAVRNGLLQ